MTEEQMPDLAHRGCRARAPDNTLEAFYLALEQGAEAIETDLRVTRDRVIVCFGNIGLGCQALVRRQSARHRIS